MAINYLDLPIGRRYPYEVDCVVETSSTNTMNACTYSAWTAACSVP